MKERDKEQEKSTEGLLDFEHMLSQYFGDKAYHNQGMREDEIAVKGEFRKVVARIEKVICGLETTNRHKEVLLNDVERLKKDLSQKSTNPWTLNIHLFSLVSRLLGYDYLKGFINTPLYHQTSQQFYTQIIFEGGDTMQDYYDSKNLIALRREIYEDLKQKGYSDFKIAQLLNTTEHQIKKLKKGL